MIEEETKGENKMNRGRLILTNIIGLIVVLAIIGGGAYYYYQSTHYVKPMKQKLPATWQLSQLLLRVK